MNVPLLPLHQHICLILPRENCFVDGPDNFSESANAVFLKRRREKKKERKGNIWKRWKASKYALKYKKKERENAMVKNTMVNDQVAFECCDQRVLRLAVQRLSRSSVVENVPFGARSNLLLRFVRNVSSLDVECILYETQVRRRDTTKVCSEEAEKKGSGRKRGRRKKRERKFKGTTILKDGLHPEIWID